MVIKRILFALVFLPVCVMATPTIQHWQTDKGTDVYFVEAHELPMVDVQIVFRAGSAYDGGKHGLAVLTNGLLNEGAGGMTADVISHNFESLGAIYSNNAGNDSSSAGLRSVSDPQILKTALENFRQVITNPEFPQDAFERQRNRTQVAIRSKQQSPGELASDAFYAAVFVDHPYGIPNIGTEETIATITVADVKKFHERYYVSKNAIVAIIGDLDRKQAEQLVTDLIAELPAGEQAPAIPEVKPLSEKKKVLISHPSTQTHILVGQPGIKYGDPDYFPLYVGNHVLGGGGMVSQLFSEIREKRGLSYSAYSYYQPMRERGPFIAGLQTRNDQAKDALELLHERIKIFVDEGPSEEELIAARKNITGGFALRIASNSKILGYLGLIGFYGLPLDYLDTFNENVERVTVEDVIQAFHRHLSPETLVSVLVGPEVKQ